MANPIVQLFTCLWAVVVGSSRVLLFLGCLGLAVAELMRASNMAGLFMDSFGADTQPPPSTSSYNPFYNPISILLYAGYGAISAFFNHSSFKVFPFLLLFCILGSGYELNKQQEKGRAYESRFQDNFKMAMRDYDWPHDSLELMHTYSTSYVDRVQQMGCCGLQERNDWDQFRPANWPSDTYPVSCCFRNATDYLADSGKIRECHTQETPPRDCRSLYQQSSNLFFMLSLLHLAYLVLLAPLSLLSQSTCCFDKAARPEHSYTGVYSS